MRFVLIVVAFAALSGCRAEKRADVAVARRAIDALNVKMEGWYVTEESDSVASVYSADAWMMPPNAAPVVGINAIREYWKNMVGMGQWTFDFNTEDLLATDTAVVERGTFTVKFAPVPNAPLPAFEDRGSYLTIWGATGRRKLANPVAGDRQQPASRMASPHRRDTSSTA